MDIHKPGTRDKLRVLLLFHVVMASVSGKIAPRDTGRSEGRCQISADPVNAGRIVDCSGLGLSQVPVHQLPDHATTLMLQDNNITVLYNNCFNLPQLRSLRHLNLRASHVTSIEVDALFGLESLETLDLEYNHLALCGKNRSFPVSVFRHVPNLKHLFIGFNAENDQNGPNCQSYVETIDILSSLLRLSNLSIDTPNETLYLGPEFSHLTSLNNITLVCTLVTTITNNSLVGLGQIPVHVLSLVNFQRDIVQFETGVFQHLPHLQHLTVNDSHVGNHNILQALASLAGRNMSSLYLRKTNGFATYSVPDVALRDGIIDQDSAKYLRSICLRHLSWIDSFLFAFKPESVTSGIWRECITSMDLSRNKLQELGWLPSLLQVERLKFLSILIISSVITPPNQHYPNFDNFTLPASNRKHNGSDQSQFDSHTKTDGDVNMMSKSCNQNDANNGVIEKETITINPDQVDHNTCNEKMHTESGPSVQDTNASKFPYNVNITFYFPPSLRKLAIVNLIFSPMTIGRLRIACANNDRFEELYWINNEMIEAKGVIEGVDRVKVLDISGSMFDIEDHLFDTFYGLRAFVLRQVRPNTFFKTISIPRLLRNLTNLMYLDLSNNQLNSHVFPVDTFSTTPNITHVILSQNRFSSIPFDLDTTPNLQLLDLSENAIAFLSSQEQAALDQLASRQGHLLLKLEGNAIACVCSNINFLAWMFISEVTIQVSPSFQCPVDDGHTLTLTDREDVPVLAILCYGRMFLMAALVLASVMVTALLVVKFRQRIAIVLAKYVSTIIQPGPEHYQIGVFVAYADEDLMFIRHVLSKFLEDECLVSTYIRHRDLGQGFEIQQLQEAISKSWRVLLVMSRSFLENYNLSQVVVQMACHLITSENPHRVFVLVERGQVQAIPSDLYDVLDDSSIIMFEDFSHFLTYKQKQGIKTCLRPTQ